MGVVLSTSRAMVFAAIREITEIDIDALKTANSGR
jgi:hypothetical protein